MRRMALGLWTVGVALAGACSSDSFHPNTTADSGTNDGGADAAVSCTHDPDCDDDDPCTGEEKCVQGFCQSGTPPCPNPDPAHCDATCAPSGSAVTCGVAARDADGDGHGDPLCAAAPGDDCDDSAASVYPGAEEKCDGIDSNCNGIEDIDDGHLLGGAPIDLVVVAGKQLRRPRIAWASNAKQFAVTWIEDDERVYVQRLTATGSKVGGAIEVGDEPYSDAQFPNIASNGDAFAIIWWGAAQASTAGWTRVLKSDGTFAAGAQLTYLGPSLTHPSIAAHGAGYVAAWAGLDVEFAGLNASGASAGSYASSAVSGYHPRVVSLGAGFLSVYSAQSSGSVTVTDQIRYAHVTSATATSEGVLDATAPSGTSYAFPVVARTPGGAFAAWRAQSSGAASVRVAEFDTAGTVVCGPVDVTQEAPSYTGGAAVNGSTRLVTHYSPAGNAVHLTRWAPGCAYAGPLLVSTPLSAAPDPASAGGTYSDVAVGDDTIVVVWQDYGTSNFIRARVFGRNYCD